ncbi:GDSL-type esterase/lipase family protein [Verrucomicrobiota bacterium sgz303538]
MYLPRLGLVLTLLASFLCASLATAQTAPPIRIMPLGDSITYGSGGTANLGGYRGPLYTLLTNAGYNVDFVGTQTDNSASIPDQNHEGHSGWQIGQLDANMVGWLGSIADPDVVLLHIGTNDFGGNNDTFNAIARLDALITKINTLRPYAHIIVTNLMERGEPYNTAIQEQFNPYVQDIVKVHTDSGQRVTFLDMRSAVPLSDMPDNLHPNQTGYQKMANAWLPAIQAVIGTNGDAFAPQIVRARGAVDRTHVSISFSKPVADSAVNVANYSLSGGLTVSAASLDAAKRVVTLTTSPQTVGTIYTATVNGITDRITPTPNSLAANSTTTFSPQIPRGYSNHVPESAGYTLAYSLDVPTAANYLTSGVSYTVDNHNGIGQFDRIAYYVELQQPDGDLQYLWASMDAFTNDVTKIAVPTLASGAVFQQGVTGLNVVSNVPEIVTGTGLAGNIEFWPTNYSAGNAMGVPGANGSVYDFGDTQTQGGNYGSMQLHNAAAGQTLFAFNNWGGTTNAGNADIGIGNNFAPVNGGVDWTFAHNAGAYTVKAIQVLVQTTGDVTPPSLVSAVASFGRSSITVSFSEPIFAASVQASNFSLNGGVNVLGATLAANQRDVILTTTAQPANTPLMLTVSGVRDTSPSANRILAGSSIAVSAPVLPPEIVANVGAAANGYQLVYSIDLPTTGNLNAAGAAAYAVDDRAAIGLFSRVAYYLELQKPGGPVQYVWAAMDAFTPNRGKIGVPTLASGALFQQPVTNLDVISNVAGVVNGNGMTGGNIEFWPTDYSAPNGASVPNASGTTYDFGDTRTTSGGNNFGSMQIHHNEASQTVLAINHFGSDGNTLDVGIGNQPSSNPDWTFAANAGTYSRRVLHVLVLPGSTTPASITNKVPEAAGYQLVATLNIPATGNLSGGNGFTNYAVDNRADAGSFSRVAYYLELKKPTETTASYVWTSMDAFTADPAKIGVPTTASGAFFQQNVSNLNVVSNVPGIVTGTGMTGGNIEFWPSNYNGTNAANVPNASATAYDFGDGGASTAQGYGSMQVHNHDAGQTLFALNNWGATNNTTNVLCLGIGNNPAPVTNGVDWTFANNANTYETRVLHIFVLPENGDKAGPVFVRANGSTALNRLIVTFDEPVADGAAAVANFAIDGGVTVIGATLMPGKREIALTTSTQTAGTVYTVTATGIRDRSPAGNLIAQGASVQFTAYTPPAVLANVPETSGYKLIYQLAIPSATPRWNFNPIPYNVDEARYGEQGFDRVAYLMELDGNWVYASFDSFTNSISKIGVPTLNVTSTPFQQNVTHMNVASNVPGIVTGTDLAGGNIEFWGGNYSQANALSIPNASATAYDFGDTMSAGGHGSMQVHNHDASQVLFAYNNWGSNSGQTSDTGIGSRPTGEPDWTFSNSASTYVTRNLYVLVRPAPLNPTGPAPQLLSQPASRSVTSGGSTTLVVTANGTGPFTYQWRLNGIAIAGATNPWLDLSGFSVAQAGTYDVVVTGPNGVTTVSQGAVLTVGVPNQNPTFSGFKFTLMRDEIASVSRSQILTKASDTDGDTLSISAVSAASQQGGSVTLDATAVVYTPPAGFLGADIFTVTISDGRGGTVVGNINASVSSAPLNAGKQSTVGKRADGKIDVLFYGTPGQLYRIERSTDLSTWATVQTITAGDDGVIPFTDANPPAGKAFYRSVAP